MKIKYLLLLAILALLIFEGCAQRGGGRSRSRSSRSGGRSRSFFFSSGSRRSRSSGNGTNLWDWLFGTDQNGTNITDSTTKNTLNDEWDTPKKTSWRQWVAAGIITFISALCCIQKNTSRDYSIFKTRNQKIRMVTDEFEAVNECRSDLNQDQRIKAIDWFMSTNWKVQIKVGYSSTVYTWNLRMKNLTKRTDFVYEIEAEGYNDDNGNSKIKGILLFRADGLSICFDKLHDDRELAGQTGKWDLLIYEGFQTGRIFQGNWYYQGFKNDLQYSGSMKMVPQ